MRRTWYVLTGKLWQVWVAVGAPAKVLYAFLTRYTEKGAVPGVFLAFFLPGMREMRRTWYVLTGKLWQVEIAGGQEGCP